MPLFRPYGVLLALLAVPTIASAQMPATRLRGPAPSVVFAPRVNGPLHASLSAVSPDTARRIHPTYWKEGALIGGVAGGVGFGALASALCEMSESARPNCARSTVLGGLIGAALVAIPGALIGGLFSKHSKSEKSDRP